MEGKNTLRAGYDRTNEPFTIKLGTQTRESSELKTTQRSHYDQRAVLQGVKHQASLCCRGTTLCLMDMVRVVRWNEGERGNI